MRIVLFSTIICIFLCNPLYAETPNFTDRELEVCAYSVRAAASARAYGGWRFAKVPLWVYKEVCLTDLENKAERDDLMGQAPREMESWATRHYKWRVGLQEMEDKRK